MWGGRREHHGGFAPASRGRRRASLVRLAGGLAGFRDHRHCDPGGPLQPALSGDAKPRRHRARQRLYRGGGDRHVDGDRVRQYRYFCRLPDRRSRHYQRNASGRGRADHSGLAHAARGRHPRHGAARRRDRLLTYSGDRGYAGDVVDPQGRPDQRHGRAIYATGGNAEAARLCGVSPRRTVVMVFALHGLFAGIAALLFATQLKVIQSTVPPNLELTVITAAVVGGVSILGGVGTVVGSTLAAVLIAEIGSALVFINVSPYWIHAVQGALILVTVVADILRRRRRQVGE